VLRRINLGNYQHYEVSVTINDQDETKAMFRALELMVRAFNALGTSDKIDLSKVQ
jgi:hypothetical protein